MRRKGTFPTKPEWLARRESAEEQSENHEEQDEPRLEQPERSEAKGESSPDRPVITLAPRRPYWR
jgi:hypothetical protein